MAALTDESGKPSLGDERSRGCGYASFERKRVRVDGMSRRVSDGIAVRGRQASGRCFLTSHTTCTTTSGTDRSGTHVILL